MLDAPIEYRSDRVDPQALTEHAEQVRFFDRVRDEVAPFHPEVGLIRANPNGGHRHYAVAVKLRREGVKAGAPDIELPVACGHYHGLAIEMKRRPHRCGRSIRRGYLSAAQRDYLGALCAQGWCVVLAEGCDMAMRALRDYLALGPFRPEGDR